MCLCVCSSVYRVDMFINEHFGTKKPAVFGGFGGVFFSGIFGWFASSALCDDFDFFSAMGADEGCGGRDAPGRDGVISC